MVKSLGKRLSSRLAPNAGRIAPGPTAAAVHKALARAIDGIGPLSGAREVVAAALAEADGDRDAATDAIVATHLRLAGAQGFLTNLGGLVTLAVTVPFNICGLALLQCRMVAAIAAVHGHDLADDRVRNAVLACLLGQDAVEDLVRHDRLPDTPRRMAAGSSRRDTGARRTPTALDRVVAAQVVGALVSDVIGKRLAVTVGKRVPVLGGLVGAGTDVWATRSVAAYARTELAT